MLTLSYWKKIAELRELSGLESLSVAVKKVRLSWLGYIET